MTQHSPGCAFMILLCIVEMFLHQKLAEQERTGQHSRSKQGLSCPRFLLSIPVLNGLSDRSKPIQVFSHAVFYPFFPVFGLFWLSNPFKTSSEGQTTSFLTEI